jgi:glucokinase
MKIGVDLGGTNIRAASICDTQVIKQTSAALRDKDNLDSTLDQLKKVIREIYDPSASGIGIGVPSIVDLEKGIVRDVVNIPSWKEVHLRDILQEEFNIPVFINNDVNCFVLGEKYFGYGRNYHSFVGVTLGTGIGAGIIIDDRLFSGKNCGAGEIGYFPYLDKDLEFYCSSSFFEQIHNTSAKLTFELAALNDAEALKRWAEFGHHLGIALRSVMYAFDPEAIILGGTISKAYKYFEKSMRLSMKNTYFPQSVAALKIHVSDVENLQMLGAAALVDQYEAVHTGK